MECRGRGELDELIPANHNKHTAIAMPETRMNSLSPGNTDGTDEKGFLLLREAIVKKDVLRLAHAYKIAIVAPGEHRTVCRCKEHG